MKAAVSMVFVWLICGVAYGESSNSQQGADNSSPTAQKIHYSPYVEQNHPNQVFFGDTHLHSSYSTDAGMIGNRLSPEQALRAARGEVVTSSQGEPVKLVRPLDFVVISDHAENLGLAPAVAEANPELLASPWGKAVYDKIQAGDVGGAFNMWITELTALKDPLKGSTLASTYWQRSTGYSEQYNEPGRFTALIGFEWTSMPNGNNLHRNVIFRDGKDKADQIVPLSAYDTSDPEELWQWMADYQRKTGGRALAIPHNGNISNGLMFDDKTHAGEPLTSDYAERRMQWEPVYEVTQIKGDGEAHPALSPNDEFADFGTWDTATLGPMTTTPEMWPREYAREALKRGLAYEQQLGKNPFKFGMIGATDSHTGLPTSQENNFFGKASLVEPSANPERFEEVIVGRPNPDASKKIRAYRSLASGLAAVYARENSREAIWDALARREVYATTGSRIRVRVFAGWEFDADDLNRSNFVEYGYRQGVPMGGDLWQAPKDKAPTLLISAMRDQDGANLERVQVIKGWLDDSGTTHERIYDVAVSDGRTIGPNGRCTKPVRSTVNLKDASYTNAVGEAAFQVAWHDPDFDPAQRAFYYVRVIEIPTPSWVARDAAVFGTVPPEDATLVIQDRAYTSPIWYTPKKS